MALGVSKKKSGSKLKRKRERSYVAIIIGDEMYGIDVRKVKEVLKISEISFVPNSLPFMKGVINLRGKIVPLIDMRLKFNLEDKEHDSSTSIVVVRVKRSLIGMIVDGVLDVVSLSLSNVQEVPIYPKNLDADCIKGISQIDDKIIIVMNVDKILSGDELKSVSDYKDPEEEMPGKMEVS